jgi:hypothetical protein
MQRAPNKLGRIACLVGFIPLIAANAVTAQTGPGFLAARWWGTLKVLDPDGCPVLNDSCDDSGGRCVCAMRIDGLLRCANARSLSSCVVPCREDVECVAPESCYGDRGGIGCCAIPCGESPPDPTLCNQPFVCFAELIPCDANDANCACMTRPDGTGQCMDISASCDSFGACPNGDADCPTGSQCIIDTCCPRRDQCFPTCGDPPPDPHACGEPGASPFCPGRTSHPCGDETLACHCTSSAADGFPTNGSGVCVDSNQFSVCSALTWCGGQGDAFCEAVQPGSRCIYDECCQWRCALNCGDAPPTKSCPNPSGCGDLPNFCGNDPGCLCMVGGDGGGICVDAAEINCALPCNNDSHCPPGTKCDGGQSCCGQRVCVPNCPSVDPLFPTHK